MNIAFVFPAQGAQYVGMGKNLFENNEIVRKTYQEASSILDLDISDISFNGGIERLQKTENTQPCIHTLEIALARCLFSEGIKPVVTSGFSLGQYASLVISKSIKFEDSLKILRKRGLYVDKHVPVGTGKMLAIVGLNENEIKKILKEASKKGTIEISDYNCPNEIIVAGYNEPIEYAKEIAIKKGARKTVELPINQPFHTSILKEPAKELRNFIEKFDIKTPEIPVVENVYAKIIDDKDNIPELLELHTIKAVKWQQCVEKMINMGVDTFLELGPGGLVSKFIDRTSEKMKTNVSTYHIEDQESLENFIKIYRD